MRPHQQLRACSAVILGGGQSRRMGGRDKARLRLHARAAPQSRRLRRLLQLRSRQVFFAAGPRGRRRAPQGCRGIWQPQYRGQGPLEGLAAAARAVRTPWVWIMPVDSAVSRAAALDRLSRAAGGRARYAAPSPGQHSLLMLLRRRDLRVAQAALNSGSQRVAQFLRTIGACPILLPHPALQSLNRPEDWRRARRLRRK